MYKIAPQPSPSHPPHKVIDSQVWLSMPEYSAADRSGHAHEQIVQEAIVNRKQHEGEGVHQNQLIKFGKFVNVCTIFLNGVYIISIKNITNITGRIEVRMLSELIANVLRNTRRTSSIWYLFDTNNVNHCRPTNSVWDNSMPGLQS